MKKISRMLALLLVLLMLATLTVSCKKKGDDEDEAIASASDNDESSTEGSDDKKGEEDKEDKDDTAAEGGNSDADSNDKDTGKDNTSNDKMPAGKEPVGEDKGEGNGAWREDAEGNVTQTGSTEFDDDFVLQGAITNDNGFIPDDEQGLAKSEREATEKSKYDFDKNPLINRDRQVNKEAMPSFAIDDTGFVRDGTTIKDLKGKTLQFFTADNFAAWSYRNAKGETISEWQWFKDLKSEVGLNIKYTVKQHIASTTAALQSMNAGKQLDVVYTNHVVYPNALCISRSITDLIAINNLGSSPGVCKNTMDTCRWGNSLRVIAPIGVVDLLWYNQTLTQELGLSDPHTMWEKGVWNWDTFKKYMLSAPKTTKDGKSLVTITQWVYNTSYVWPSTNGKQAVKIDATAKVPTLVNNWGDAQVMAAWEFISNIHATVNYKNSGEDKTTGVCPEHMGLYEGTTLMSATMYTQVYRDTEYSKHVQINWVPFPKANTATGKEICQYYGFGMVLPRKTAKEGNVGVAIKFMELWATRFTETLFDNLNTFEYYNFNYKQRKQYFDFVTQNVVFGLAMNDWDGSGLSTETAFTKAIAGNSAYNVRTEAEKAKNLVNAYIISAMKYGS